MEAWVYFGDLCSATLIYLYVSFYASTQLFRLLWSCCIVCYQVVWYLQLCSFFSRFLWLFVVFCSFIYIFGLFVLVYEICHWYFDRKCTESISCFGWYGYFKYVSYSYPRTWYMLPFICVLFSFFSQCVITFQVQVFYFLVKYIPRCFFFFNGIVNGIVFLVFLSDSSLFVYKNVAYFQIFILYLAALLNSFISSSSLLVEL